MRLFECPGCSCQKWPLRGAEPTFFLYKQTTYLYVSDVSCGQKVFAFRSQSPGKQPTDWKQRGLVCQYTVSIQSSKSAHGQRTRHCWCFLNFHTSLLWWWDYFHLLLAHTASADWTFYVFAQHSITLHWVCDLAEFYFYTCLSVYPLSVCSSNIYHSSQFFCWAILFFNSLRGSKALARKVQKYLSVFQYFLFGLEPFL